MTEDDTFLALKRTPFAEVLRLWRLDGRDAVFIEFDEFLKEHNWTRYDFTQIWVSNPSRKI